MEVGAGPRVEFILQPAEDCRMFLLAALYNYEITGGQDGGSGNNLVVSCLVSVTWNIAETLTLTLTPGTVSPQLPTINTSTAELLIPLSTTSWTTTNRWHVPVQERRSCPRKLERRERQKCIY